MNSAVSKSAPSTPTEQAKQIHTNMSIKKKAKRNKGVHFPNDEMLVTCFLDPPDPWSKDYGNTIDTLVTAYVAACDKQSIKPLACVMDQLQEYESNIYKLETNPRAFDLIILGEKLSVKHCEALEEILRRLQFNLIDLEGCYLEDEKLIAQLFNKEDHVGAAAFFDMIEYYDSAVQLNISFTKHIDCRGWQACSRMLKKTTSLVHLNARSTGLNEQVLLIVGRALRLGSNLVTLHLENCGIFGRCLVILVAALKLNTTLRELFLAENKISSADGFQLGNLLRTNTHLELLDLSNNKLGDEGLTHVMDSLGQQSNTSGRGLSTLILWNNELTEKGMPCVSRALTSARAIRRLNLGSNLIMSSGIQEMKQSFICNRTIEILELENAGITSEGAFALAEYISQNQFLQKLDLRGNDIRLEGLKALSRVMENNANIVSLRVDPTSKDLSEPIKERQAELQEISKFCQRNKEAKSSLPPQDAQLSTLFNGIFSHVLPTTSPVETQQQNIGKSSFNGPTPNCMKGRFRVSVVVLNQDGSDCAMKKQTPASRSVSLDVDNPFSARDLILKPCTASVNETVKHVPSENLVSDRVKWIEDLSVAGENRSQECMSDHQRAMCDEMKPSDLKQKKSVGLTLNLNSLNSSESELKARRLSSPTISSAPPVSRKTHSIKCCKELEGLDLRSTVPLSPTRLHESFDFPEPEVSEGSLNAQMNIKSSQTLYMVH